MPSNSPQEHISKSTVNRLAAKEKREERGRLWQGLQAFANLGDTPDDLKRFRLMWPTFYPVDVRVQGRVAGLSDEFHKAILLLRDCLRNVWIWRDPQRNRRGDPVESSPEVFLRLLLGLSDNLGSLSLRFHGDPLKDEILAVGSGEATGLRIQERGKLWSLFPSALPAGPLRIEPRPDWHRGVLDYEAQTDFQRALWFLFRHSWRAKTCARCGAYFVAEKPPQIYCSVKCSVEAKRERSSQWWGEHGNEWRKKRAKQKRRASR